MKRFADLQSRECQWPVGDCFCGERTDARSRPYCPEHERQAHRATSRASEAQQRSMADFLTGSKERRVSSEVGRYGIRAVDRVNWRKALTVGFQIELMATNGAGTRCRR